MLIKSFIIFGFTLALAYGAKSVRILDNNMGFIAEEPYLMQLTDAHDIFFCTGALIDFAHVVTAAHCLVGRDPSQVVAVAGAAKGMEHAAKSSVSNIMVHPMFNNDNPQAYDIAVLKLASPMKRSQYIGIIPLASKELSDNQIVQFKNWYKSELDLKPKVITSRGLTISKAECGKWYDAKDISLSTMCIRGKGASNFEAAGAPLIRRGELCGVMSGTRADNKQNYTAIYTGISSVVDFIEAALKT